MTRILAKLAGPALVALIAAIAAIAAHLAFLALAPSFIMDRAMQALAQRGVALHGFTAPLRITPQTQTIVRSSPDLFYALCRYDLSAEGSRLEVVMNSWPDYQSLSFFDDETNNFATMRGTGEPVEVTLTYQPEGASSLDEPPSGTITSPSAKGVILIRRLAPTKKDFARARRAARLDRCTYKKG